MRARIVYASKERVKQTALNYEDLASAAWKGKICIRSGQHYYNTALFAAYIVKHGEAQAEQWLQGPQGQPRRRSRPAATARPPATSRPASATSASATPITTA